MRVYICIYTTDIYIKTLHTHTHTRIFARHTHAHTHARRHACTYRYKYHTRKSPFLSSGNRLSLWKSGSGFDPGFERPACLATLKSSD